MTTQIHADCPTCICGDTHSLDYLNRRCARLLAEHPTDLSAIGEDRLSVSERYRCGFREFLLSASNDKLGATFMLSVHLFARPVEPKDYSVRHGQAACSVEDEEYETLRNAYRRASRYFAVVVQRPGSPPRPVEYNLGDCFELRDAPSGYDFDQIRAMSDAELLAWLDAHRVALREFVVAATSYTRATSATS